MKKLILFFLSGILIMSVNSCKKTPLGCASSDKSSVLTNETVNFTSCSENALRIAWDFGDGKTEEGNEVSHSYSMAGIYLIKMTAYSKKDKRWDKTALVVTVADPPVPPAPLNRYLTKIVLKSVAEKKSNGEEWDGLYALGTSTGTSTSDPYIVLKLNTGGWSMSGALFPDISATALPATWNFSPQNITLVNENWTIELLDGVYGNGLYDTGSELMNSWTSVNLATASASGGVISLTYGTSPDYYAIDIYFEER